MRFGSGIVEHDFSLRSVPEYQGIGLAILACLYFVGVMGLTALFSAFLVACMAGSATFLVCLARPQVAQVAVSPSSEFATSLDPLRSRRWLPTFSMGSLLWFVIHVALLSGCFVLARDRAPPMAMMACFLAALVAQAVHLWRASNGVATRAMMITVAAISACWLCMSLWEVVQPSLFLPTPESHRNDLSNLFHTSRGWGLISLILPLCAAIVSGVCWCAMRGKAWLALSSLCLLVAWLGVLGFAIGSD